MKISLNFETFGALAAIIASFAALWVAWDQARVMRAEQHAGAWPYGYMATNFSSDEEFDYTELMFSNPGVGPALVREAYLLSGDEVVTNWWDLVRQTFPEELQETAQFAGAGSAVGVIAVGEERQIIRINWPHSDEPNSAYNTYLRDAIAGDAPIIGLRVCYCSVYDRCWRGQTDLNGLGQDHEEVDSCGASGDFISTIFTMPEDLAVDASADRDTAVPSVPPSSNPQDKVQ